MSFYNILSKYYDDIFKLDNTTLNFLAEGLKCEDKVLDVACGTGTYAIALKGKGFKVVGVDLDANMIKKAKEKDKGITFLDKDMSKLKGVFDQQTFSSIYCIGNSIVHLNSKNDILKAIEDFYCLLQNDGYFTVGIINYDRIINCNITELPLINREDPLLTFKRNYEYNPIKKVIYFNTQLKVVEEVEKVYENSVKLLPIMKDELYEIFRKVGFKNIEVYGGFGKKNYELNDYTLVVRGKK